MKKRAVAYIRVSTRSEKQSHSYEFQEQYWKDELAKNSEVEFIRTYADYGISGRSQYKRPQFLEMIESAKAGEIDIIYTKSVQRFGRNAKELLTTVRELRELGVGVIFDKEGINTIGTESEMYLIIASSIAESELNSNSENQKWAYREKFSKGFVSIGSQILGYEMQEDNTLKIVEHEAEIIRCIYGLYANGETLTNISKILKEKNYATKNGVKKWNRSSITHILDNEKYVGDNIQQKTIVIGGVSYDNKNGKHSQQWAMEDVHPPIVSRELDNAVKERRKNIEKRLKKQQVYDFTSKITCGCCGSTYMHKVQNARQKWECEVWACHNGDNNGLSACANKRIKDAVLREKFVECYNRFIIEKDDISTINKSEEQLKKLQESENDLEILKMNRLIEQSYYMEEKDKLVKAISQEKTKLDMLRTKLTNEDRIPLKEFSIEKFNKYVTKVIIQNWVVTFKFKNGKDISVEYTNGKGGNKKGWAKNRDNGGEKC